MRACYITATLLMTALAVQLGAQEETFFSEVVEVRVTNVDVIVTGRDGKPVTGLTRDDFEIYENGVRQEISNFLEIRESVPALTGAPGEPMPAAQDLQRRDITIFIDNSSIHPFRRNEILPLLGRFVERNVRPGDSLGLVTWASSLKLELEPTTDRKAIDDAVKRVQSQAVIGVSDAERKAEFYRQIALLIRAHAARASVGGASEKPSWAQGMAEARSYAMTTQHRARQRIEALKSVIAWRRGVEGRKILLILTTEMPINPAEEPFLYLEAVKENFLPPYTIAISEARDFEIPSLVQEITAAANSSGVTLYPIDTTGKEPGLPQNDASQAAVLTSRGPVERPNAMPTLRSIAAETGGVALSGSDNWQLAFDTISNDLGTYYSLGYRSTGERRDRMKKVEVKLNNKRHNVRTRRAVVEKSIGSEMQDAVAANLFRPATANDLAIRVTLGEKVAREDGTALVPLTVTIPMDKLTLVPREADLTGRIAIYAAFQRKDGAVSKVAQQPAAIRFPAESLERRKELTVKIDVNADDETNAVSIGVMDETSRATGFASAEISGSARTAQP